MTPLVDSFSGLYGGQNSEASPLLLSQEVYARGINIDIRGGLVKTRPGFVADELIMPGEEEVPSGKFQGAARWALPDGDRLVFVVDGFVYIYNVDTGDVFNAGALVTADSDFCWFCQADNYMVIQNGSDTPVVLDDSRDGKVFGYEDGDEQSIPIGTAMYYIHQRLHTTDISIGLRYFESGDVMIPTRPESCLEFTETTYWATGGAHALPVALGEISGMAAFRNASTGTGVGTLLVFADNGVSSFDLSYPRSEWDTVNMSQVLFMEYGSRSPRSLANVNDDLIYRALDGMRTVRYTKSEVGSGTGSLASLPFSLRVDTWFRDEAQEYLPFVSAAFWNHYAMMTVSGVDDRYFQGLVVMDSVSTHVASGASNPAFPGVWTGFKFAQVLVAMRGYKRTVFVFVDGLRLYHLDEDATTDDGVSIMSRLITRSHGFGGGASAKQLQFVEFWMSDIYKTSAVTVYFRPTGYPLWSSLGTRVVKPAVDYPGYKRRLRFAVEDASAFRNVVTGELLNVSTEFQFAIEIEGNLTIERCLMAALQVDEPPPNPCDVDPGTGTLTGVALDDWYYSVDGEGTLPVEGVQYGGVVSLPAGITEYEIELSGLDVPPSRAFVTMEGREGDGLLFPMITGRTATALTVAWQSETVGSYYKLHWEVVA